MKHIIFTIPKAFNDSFISKIQTNAILSWSFITDNSNIILCGNESGVAEFSYKNNLIHLPNIKTGNNNIPLLNDAFYQVQEKYPADVYTYVNADIIFLPNYKNIISDLTQTYNQFLAIGCRYNLDINFLIDFSSNWDLEILNLARKNGIIKNTTWTDYFTFTNNFWDIIPEFYIGRTIFDIWLLSDALLKFKNVIDVTDVNPVIHQNHEYTQGKYKKNEMWYGKEAYINHQNAGKYYYLGNIKYAYYKFTNNKIINNWEKAGFNNKEQFLNYALLESASDLLINGKYDKCIEMLELLEEKNFVGKNFYYTFGLAYLNLGYTQKAIDYLKKEYELFPNDDILLTLNQIKNFNIFKINLSVLIYGFQEYSNIDHLIKKLKKFGINSIYIISNNPSPAKENKVPYIETISFANLPSSFNKVIKNSVLNDYILFINGDLFDISDDFIQKLNQVYQPYNYVHVFYFNTLLKNQNNQVEGFFIQRDYFYEHNKMYYYHLVSNKILFDCFVIKRKVFDHILFDTNNQEFIHKFWLDFFKHKFITKLVPFYTTILNTNEYYDLELRLLLNVNDYTAQNIFYTLENTKLSELFSHLNLTKDNNKSYGDITLFLFNLLVARNLYKAAISVVTQVASYTNNVDILNICIPFLIENFDLKLLKNILSEFKFMFDNVMFDKLVEYIDKHIHLSVSLFQKSPEVDRIINLVF